MINLIVLSDQITDIDLFNLFSIILPPGYFLIINLLWMHK